MSFRARRKVPRQRDPTRSLHHRTTNPSTGLLLLDLGDRAPEVSGSKAHRSRRDHPPHDDDVEPTGPHCRVGFPQGRARSTSILKIGSPRNRSRATARQRKDPPHRCRRRLGRLLDEEVVPCSYEVGWMVVPEFHHRGIAVVAPLQPIELARRDANIASCTPSRTATTRRRTRSAAGSASSVSKRAGSNSRETCHDLQRLASGPAHRVTGTHHSSPSPASVRYFATTCGCPE
jgi:hypothetical protein